MKIKNTKIYRSLFYLHNLILLSIMLVLTISCKQDDKWIQLFNGENLENWDIYLGPPFPDLENLAEKTSPESVYSVVEIDNEKVIRISGEVHGSLATKESFGNYHLEMIFKWGNYVPHGRNSGLLYHSYNPFGASYWTWMGSMEFQLMHNNLGDAYMMDEKVVCTASVEETNNNFIYKPQSDNIQFGEPYKRRMIRKSIDSENPLGEWNVVELFCFDRKAIHVVNGKTVLISENIGKYMNGNIEPLTKGKIQLQSEGGELFIKSIRIRPITSIPSGLE